MRAQRRANQPVDPVIYCDYYLLLEATEAILERNRQENAAAQARMIT